jgi:CD109 antigen
LFFSYFTIVGSKVIRPDTEYHLSVMSQGYKQPTTFRVSINGTEDDGRIFVQSKDVTFVNDQEQSIVFDVSEIS